MKMTVVIILVAVVACAEDDLTKEATEYVAKHEAKGDSAKWASWWKGRAEQLQADFPDIASEELAADRYLTQWFRDRQAKLKEHKDRITVEEKVTMCRFYLLYKGRRWTIPERVGEHITKKAYDEMFAEVPK
jgi:hypothetical protein